MNHNGYELRKYNDKMPAAAQPKETVKETIKVTLSNTHTLTVKYNNDETAKIDIKI